jgi:ferritin
MVLFSFPFHSSFFITKSKEEKKLFLKLIVYTFERGQTVEAGKISQTHRENRNKSAGTVSAGHS